LSYLRGCPAEKFSSLRYVLAGAEKLRESIANAFKKKFGLDLLEGYGCTEMGPVVSVNLPDPPSGDSGAGFRTGTVGRPIPGVSVKIVHPLTGNDLPAGHQGLLLARGPNQMIGYLGQPERTAEVLRDGWYVTGDIASVDEDGFVTILDRLSRFSKVGGEMVPHLKIEETVSQILGDHGCVVTSVPDEQKGERLAVFYTQKQTAPEELWDRLNRAHLPNLWIPKKDDIHWIDAIPLLGSGKIDLKRIKTMALEMENR
jgi:acyl-[acyl-carrier-protein]-phospholipid O-acyltransferase/long-chain-fatty-acid--[acyl-carrier-protein] ligase